MSYCIDCAQQVIAGIEKKALDGEEAMVWRSSLTQEWVCPVTGDEHQRGSANDYAKRVRTAIAVVTEMVENGDLTASQGLHLIRLDAGLAEHSQGSKKIGTLTKAIESGLPTELLATYLDNRRLQSGAK